MKYLLGVFLLFSFSFYSYSQKRVLTTYGLEGLDLSIPKFVKDSLEANKVARSIIGQLHALSYLGASLDSSKNDSTNYHFYFERGKVFKWVNLHPGNLPVEDQGNIDLSGRLFLNKPFNGKQLNNLFKRIINYYENRGYPFASVQLDSVSINSNNEINASLKLAKNSYYKVDSFLVKGNIKVSQRYLLNYLNIKEGQAYNENSISQISKRFREIPFLIEKKPHEIQFFEEGVKILVYPEKKRASRFDGILGLLTEEETGKIEFTGDIDLNLINSFNKGEKIGFNWRKLKGNSQDLNLDLEYPFIFNTDFGLGYHFKLFRRDTTFIDLSNRLGVNYSIGAAEYIDVFIENKSSRLLSKNSFLNNPQSLPNLGDVSINQFGVGYRVKRYDYLLNPTKGVGLATNFAVGTKRLEKIAALEEENPNIYDGIELNTIQYSALLDFSWFIKVGKRSTILLRTQSATIYSENIYQNELLRIGGLKILRGFDEESISASLYSVNTAEYRFLLDRNSFFSLFTDLAYYESEFVGTYSKDTPIGIGAGISFETKAGIFSFNYAIGQQQNNPLDFRAAKIHFGFINIF